MAFNNASMPIGFQTSVFLNKVGRMVHGLLGAEPLGLTAEESMAVAPLADERLRPRAPMNHDQIDISTLAGLGNMGIRHGKLITAESHPELYAGWQKLSARAGLERAPQLIMAESRGMNALTLGREEVVLTTELMKHMTLPETFAILGHELGHATSNHGRVRMLSTGIFGGIGLLVGNAIGRHAEVGKHLSRQLSKWEPLNKTLNFFFRPHRVNPKPASLLGYAFYIGLGATIGHIVANQLSVKPTELESDTKAAAISGDPRSFISALKKLDEAHPRQSIKSKFRFLQSGYPTMGERIRNLEQIAEAMESAQPITPAAETARMPMGPAMQVHAVEQAGRTQLPPPERELSA